MNPTDADIKKGDHILVQVYDTHGASLTTRQATVIAMTRIVQYLEDNMFVLVRYPDEGSRCKGYGCVPLKQIRKADDVIDRI